MDTPLEPITLSESVKEADISQAISSAPLPMAVTETMPNAQVFDIDEDNMIFNGDAYFWLGEVKTILKTFQPCQPPPAPQHTPIPTIGFCFAGTQLGFPFADITQRDEIFEELKRRFQAIKNGTAKAYISRLKNGKK